MTTLNQPLIVRGAPAIYRCEAGILHQLESLLQPYGSRRVLVVHGERSWEAAAPYWPQQTELTLLPLPYRGECTLAEASRIAREARAAQADIMLGVGGGKVMDLVKAAGIEAGLDTVLVPTLASNCAAWTPLSVFYDEQGRFTHYTLHPKSPLMVLVDPQIALRAPAAYLRAGIADTLAKWYEADVLVRQWSRPPAAVQIAHLTARLCQTALLEHGLQSVRDAERQQLTDAFTLAVETIIMTGGTVGGFGDHAGRIAGAHSIHNGLTAAPATHHLLHGDKVAYGILVQLTLEGNLPEVERLLPFYQDMGLPRCLSDLGLSASERAPLERVAAASVLPQESIHLMNRNVTADDVRQAMVQLESVSARTA